MQNQHRSVDTILVQDQFVRLPDPRYDPFLRRIDKRPDGFGTAGVIGGEDWLFAQSGRDVDLELYGTHTEFFRTFAPSKAVVFFKVPGNPVPILSMSVAAHRVSLLCRRDCRIFARRLLPGRMELPCRMPCRVTNVRRFGHLGRSLVALHEVV